MAISNKSSTQISNRDGFPAVRSDSRLEKASLQRDFGFVQAINGDSATSIYRMVSLKSNTRLSAIKLMCEALGAGAAVDIGAYYGNDAKDTFKGDILKGSVINSAFFGTAIDVSAALPGSNVTNESGSYTLDKQAMPLYQALGLASDPECRIDICITVSVAIAATGLIALELDYTE